MATCYSRRFTSGTYLNGDESALRLFCCDHLNIPLPGGHKFPLAKYRLLRERLEEDGRFTIERAPPADRAAIYRAHDPEYVDAFIEGRLSSQTIRRIGFPWSEGLVARTLCSVGATLAATRAALETGFGGALAGGTHHAHYTEGSGFCVFNDIAIAIKNCGRRAAVIDLDVHLGDGTAAIFSGDDTVLTLSLHGQNNFPLRKQTSTIDLAFPDGTGDDEYLAALGQVLPRVVEFRPEIVFYQSGVDGLASDKLGLLALTPEGLAIRDRMVFHTVKRIGVPVVTVLGGGYANPIELTVDAHAATFRCAADEGPPGPVSLS
jgi:acetoin utilization deacetylase AcuC-like enzyme